MEKKSNERLLEFTTNVRGESVELFKDGSIFRLIMRNKSDVLTCETSNKDWADWFYKLAAQRRPNDGLRTELERDSFR